MSKGGYMQALGRFGLLAATTFAAAIGAAWMVRLAPGEGVDAYHLDARLSDSSVEALRKERAASDIPAWIARLAAGELGQSAAFGQPIRELVEDRAT